MDDSDGNTPFHFHFNYLLFVFSLSFSFLLVDKVIKGFRILTFFLLILKKIGVLRCMKKSIQN